MIGALPGAPAVYGFGSLPGGTRRSTASWSSGFGSEEGGSLAGNEASIVSSRAASRIVRSSSLVCRCRFLAGIFARFILRPQQEPALLELRGGAVVGAGADDLRTEKQLPRGDRLDRDGCREDDFDLLSDAEVRRREHHPGLADVPNASGQPLVISRGPIRNRHGQQQPLRSPGFHPHGRILRQSAVVRNSEHAPWTICDKSFHFMEETALSDATSMSRSQVCLLRIARVMAPAATRDAATVLARRGRFIDAATFGAFLENHRAGRNLSLHDVAAETKIAVRHLAALERGDVRSWPGGLYRRAMVRAYAAAIGLDPEVTVCEFVDAFNEAPATAPVELETSPAPAALDVLLGVRQRASVCVGLALCATIAVLSWAATSSDAAGAIDTNRFPPESTVGDDATAHSATTTSGLVSPPDAANAETYQPIATAVSQQPASSIEPPAHVEASMRIISEPTGARVTVNGIRWGQTPVTVRHLAPGEKRVRISKDGYTSAERRLQLTSDNPTQTVRMILAVE